MKIVIFVLILFIMLLCFRLFLLKPSFRRLFKKEKNENRISVSYAILFNISNIANIIQKKLEESQDIPLYIEAYQIRKYFDKTQNLEEIQRTLRIFQKEVDEDIVFNNMYSKSVYEVLMERWVKYSKYNDYRRICLVSFKKLYRRREICIKDLVKLMRIFCGF